MAPIRRALFPGYAKLASEPSRMRGMFVDIFALTLWAGAPIPIAIGLLAEPLVNVMLGSSWAEVVPVTQLLVIAGFTALLSSGSHPVYLASGRPELQTLLAGLCAVLLLPAVIVGVNLKGAIGAALALVLVQTLIAFLDIAIVLSLLRLDVRTIAAACWRSIAALGLMAAAVHAIVRAWPQQESIAGDALLLLTATTTGGALYLTCSLLLGHLFSAYQGPERHVRRAMIGAMTAFRAKVA